MDSRGVPAGVGTLDKKAMSWGKEKEERSV